MMPTQSNSWDEKYTEACSRMSASEQDHFIYGLVGSMSAYLDEETLAHCIRIAETLVATDMTDRLAKC